MQQVQDRQSLLDIALQTAGSVEAGMDLAVRNGISVSDDLSDGLELSTAPIIDTKVKQQYDVQGIRPATATSLDELAGYSPSGIGEMCVGVDFEVSI